MTEIAMIWERVVSWDLDSFCAASIIDNLPVSYLPSDQFSTPLSRQNAFMVPLELMNETETGRIGGTFARGPKSVPFEWTSRSMIFILVM